MSENDIPVEGCKNNYTFNEYEENFYVSEKESKICDECDNLRYDSSSGIVFCKLMDSKEEDAEINEY